jgi:hypothetical protein
MGYAGFSRGEIFRALKAARREPMVEAMRNRRVVHEASLDRFLIFVN